MTSLQFAFILDILNNFVGWQKIPTIPDDVEQVVMIALAKEPQKRFMIISAFAAALEEAVKSEAASTFVPEATSNTPTMTAIPPTIVASLTSDSHLTPSWPATERSPMVPSLSSPSSAPDISTSSRMKAPFQGKVSRRNVILGLGGLAVAGSGIAAFSFLQKQFSPSLAHNTTPSTDPTSTTAATPTSAPSPQPTLSGVGTTHVTYRGQYSTVSWSHDGARIVSGGNGATSEVWDAATGSLFFSYNTQASTVYSVKYSPNGTRIASGDSNGVVQIWDAATGNPLVTCTGHAHQVNAVSWSPDGSRIASASGDKTVRIWDASTGNSLYTYRGHPHYVNAVAWSPSGSYVASGGGDTTVQVWGPTTGNVLNTYRGHSKDVLALSWLRDSSRLASASDDGTVRVWQAS